MNLHKDGLNNVKVIVDDAAKVFPERVRPGSVDRVLVYFPDPWPKKRHPKRRLLDSGFLDVLADSLKPGGFCMLRQTGMIMPIKFSPVLTAIQASSTRPESDASQNDQTTGRKPSTSYVA
ncbi:MAG: hypothetical protein Ct9H300mP16_14790 [Pseudomonadota bacterium]|nr:MAG: hypothetical protein Ct9H300mP16_14790 [Pseudomonadota bacterium]